MEKGDIYRNGAKASARIQNVCIRARIGPKAMGVTASVSDPKRTSTIRKSLADVLFCPNFEKSSFGSIVEALEKHSIQPSL